ncbi:MAG: ATP-grasp domain-containing protein [Acidobacteria bacterium]|nr:ATP-grasp domain-containing protein [Acidobacteriota bacterium]
MNLSSRITHKLERWLRQCRDKKAPAIILGASVNGLSFVRSLGRRGIPTLLLDSEPFLGAFTRYGKVLLLPATDAHPPEWLAALDFVASRLDSPAVLFATSDAHCLWVSQHRELLRSSFRFLIPPSESVEQIVNKRSQYGLAQAAGLRLPLTWFPESFDELRDLASQLVYPCLLKPYTSYQGRQRLDKQKVLIVDSPPALLTAYERLTVGNLRFMIQEIIPGADTALYGYLGFWDAQGRERAWLTKQKLRQSPPYFGDGSLQRTVAAPEVAELSRRLLRAFNYTGLVNIEFKYDARDGSYRLMEINPRSAASNQMAISAGVDFPWMGYQYLTAADPDGLESMPFRPQVKCVNEEWEIQAYFAYRKFGALNLWRWLQSLYGAKLTIFAWSDPLPFLVGFWRLLKISCAHLWSLTRR